MGRGPFVVSAEGPGELVLRQRARDRVRSSTTIRWSPGRTVTVRPWARTTPRAPAAARTRRRPRLFRPRPAGRRAGDARPPPGEDTDGRHGTTAAPDGVDGEHPRLRCPGRPPRSPRVGGDPRAPRPGDRAGRVLLPSGPAVTAHARGHAARLSPRGAPPHLARLPGPDAARPGRSPGSGLDPGPVRRGRRAVPGRRAPRRRPLPGGRVPRARGGGPGRSTAGCGPPGTPAPSPPTRCSSSPRRSPTAGSASAPAACGPR